MSAWPGWTASHSLLLPVDFDPPPRAVRLHGRVFAPKHELHVTLVDSRLGTELAARLGRGLDAATRPAFEAQDWRLARSGRLAWIEKAGRTDAGARGRVASIVEFVELPALPPWYRRLGELLGRELEPPPAHVTLYVHGRARGIGIRSERALRRLLRAPVDAAALDAA